MGHGLSHYYGKAKGGIAGINPKEAADLFEDWAIVAATGAAIGAISAGIGGLDKHFGSIPVPVDGVASLALGFIGLSIGSEELKTASIAAGGSASVRTFEAFFKKAMKANGEFDEGTAELGMGAGYGYDPSYGWGADTNDSLVNAAQYL